MGVEAADLFEREREREAERLADFFERDARRARRLRLPLMLPEASDVLSEAMMVTSVESGADSRARSSLIRRLPSPQTSAPNNSTPINRVHAPFRSLVRTSCNYINYCSVSAYVAPRCLQSTGFA